MEVNTYCSDSSDFINLSIAFTTGLHKLQSLNELNTSFLHLVLIKSKSLLNDCDNVRLEPLSDFPDEMLPNTAYKINNNNNSCCILVFFERRIIEKLTVICNQGYLILTEKNGKLTLVKYDDKKIVLNYLNKENMNTWIQVNLEEIPMEVDQINEESKDCSIQQGSQNMSTIDKSPEVQQRNNHENCLDMNITFTPEISMDEINRMYPDACNFFQQNIVIKGNGHELLNNSGHVKNISTQHWKNSTFGPFKLHNTCPGPNKIYKCPIPNCYEKMTYWSLTTAHLENHHGYEKFLCPIGFPRHIVPVVCNERHSMIIHIKYVHDGLNVDPIKIHTRQLTFPFTVLALNSHLKLFEAELNFTKERIEACKLIKERGFTEHPDIKWITFNDLTQKEKIKFMSGIKERHDESQAKVVLAAVLK
ncbi:hypothetical protein ACKWTF_000323 [Chironomus riparius]